MTWRVTFTGDFKARARSASEAAAKAVSAELDGRFQDAIGSQVWPWPRDTVRSDGKIAGSPRTIVDSSHLKDKSQYEVNGLTVRFEWTQPYATAVHEGARLETKGYQPARPWTGAVLGTTPVSGIPVYDLQKRFRETWLNHFNRS